MLYVGGQTCCGAVGSVTASGREVGGCMGGREEWEVAGCVAGSTPGAPLPDLFLLFIIFFSSFIAYKTINAINNHDMIFAVGP